jgi:hypothetical protein
VFDDRFLRLLAKHRRRFQVATVAVAVVVSAAAAGVALGSAALGGAGISLARLLSVAAFVLTAGPLTIGAWRRWTPARVASALEARAPLDNLVITAEEIAAGRHASGHPVIRDAVFAGAFERLDRISPVVAQPLARSVVMAALSVFSLITLLLALPQRAAPVAALETANPSNAAAPLQPGELRVIVTAPSYAGRRPVVSVNPERVTALEGSTVRLEVGEAPDRTKTVLYDLDGSQREFSAQDQSASLELVASASRPLLVRQARQDGDVADRLVHLRVDRDEGAVVSIRQPAKDLIFADGRGRVPVEIEARDDVALATLALRYTRVSGSGETFTFEEGEWPVDIIREGAANWRASAVFSLDSLNLQDGDSIVYRAIARDSKPGAAPASSESYLIEIGRLAGAASQGFAVPEERDRHAISQQMVIVKTEKLHASRGAMEAAEFLEQSQLLAVEQRMVQAEFVFMTGGHVHDEVEEAAQSHEIAEGRLENSATAEMMNAIREMSRAEARLNAGDTVGALQFERAALKALQRAFDRRRYFLRTLPERARIDPSRRLTGDLALARSSTLSTAVPEPDQSTQRARELLDELGAPGAARGNLSLLASRMLALDTSSEALQNAALQLTAAQDDDARARAVREAQRTLMDVLVRATATPLLPLSRDTVRGRLAQELAGGGPPR